MDQPPKRRVLSLSLSQPGKQNKKLRLKRNVSNISDNDSNKDTEDFLKSSNSRDDMSIDIPPPSSQGNSKPSKVLLNSLSVTTGQEVVKPLCEVKGLADSLLGNDDPIQRRPCQMSSLGEKDTSANGFVEKAACTEEEVPPQKEQSTQKNNSYNNLHSITEQRTVGASRKSSSFCNNVSASAEYKKTTELEDGDCVTAVKPFVETANHLEKGTNVDSRNECIEVLQCPLCYRNFNKLTTKTSHMKSCALKHKLTTQQLLEVIELQQRQAAERKALGLPEIPLPAGNMKKIVASKKENRLIPKMDNNLQLAVALSLSLQDQEKCLEDVKRTETMMAKSLDHFGFTAKSVLEAAQPRSTSPVSRGKGKTAEKKRPPLLTRSAEERQRIITEKVAMVLMEEVVSESNESVHDVDLQSRYLQDCVQKDNLLWAKTHSSPSKTDRASYYVKGLRGFISPSKVETGSKVMHLSQIVGRFMTPTQVKVPKQKEPSEVIPASPSDAGNSSDSSSHLAGSRSPSHLEMELRAKLFNDWAGMVNSSAMSDFTIYPQEGREIPGHKIIFHVRCPQILQDISRQRNPLTGNEVEVIMWSNTPHVAALAFLEYIYCGSVKSIRVFGEDLSSIIWLAKRYKVNDLTRYLNALTESNMNFETPSQVALNVVRDIDEDGSVSKRAEQRKSRGEPQKCPGAEDSMSTPILKEREVIGLKNLRTASPDVIMSPAMTPTRSETDSMYSEITLPGAGNRSSCSSPDMFGDEESLQTEDPTVVEATLHQNFCPVNDARNEVENNQRPPSQCGSISSEKTVIIEKNIRVHSPVVSICSDKTDLVGMSPEPSSPAPSNMSGATELLDYNQDVSHQSKNDSKRRHSNTSEDCDTSSCKRPCPPTPSPSHMLQDKNSDVECFDLTQDSDSNASFPVVGNNFSGESCDKIVISSDNDITDSEGKNEQTHPVNQVDKNLEMANSSESRHSVEINQSEAAGDPEVSLTTKDPEPYISPVWDGFEDLNYDPFSYDLCPDNSNSPPEKHASPKLAPSEGPLPIKKNVTQAAKESVPPQKTGLVDRKKSPEETNSSHSEALLQTPKMLPRNPQPSTSSGFEALLDDSLNINDTLLQQAESGLTHKLTQREAKGTPLNRIISDEQKGVTPLMNYSAMKTPELKRELQKFGLKPSLGKRKGKIMLRHIYNELHPWVPVNSEANSYERESLSQPSCSSKVTKPSFSCSQPNTRKLTFSDSDALEGNGESSDESDTESDDSQSGVNTSRQEIMFLEGECSDTEKSQATQPVGKADLPKVVLDFILNDRELHQSVLEYEPILIDKLQKDLRSKGYKFKMPDLMALLDEKCITFRTMQGSGPRVKNRNKKLVNSKQKTTCTAD